MLEPGESAVGNGYRVYSREHVERAQAIRMAQAYGFSLKEIKALIDRWDGGTLSEENKRAFLDEKLTEIENKMSALEGVRRYLLAKRAWLDGGGEGEPPRWEDAERCKS